MSPAHLPASVELQDAEKTRAVAEAEAAAAMQCEVAIKYCMSLDALQVRQQQSFHLPSSRVRESDQGSVQGCSGLGGKGSRVAKNFSWDSKLALCEGQ